MSTSPSDPCLDRRAPELVICPLVRGLGLGVERVHGLAVRVAADEHVPDPVHGAPGKVGRERIRWRRDRKYQKLLSIQVNIIVESQVSI